MAYGIQLVYEYSSDIGQYVCEVSQPTFLICPNYGLSNPCHGNGILHLHCRYNHSNVGYQTMRLGELFPSSYSTPTCVAPIMRDVLLSVNFSKVYFKMS